MTTIVNGVATDAAATTDQTPWETVTFTKADVTAGGATAWTTANSPLTIFTVTGRVLMRVFGVVTTSFTSTSNTGTIALGAGATTTLLHTTYTANGTQLQENGLVAASTGQTTAGGFSNSAQFQIVNGVPVILTVGTNDMTAGGIVYYCQWIALSDGATVV